VKLHIVTGGYRDFLELTPDTIEEAAGLVHCGTSQFVDHKKAALLVVTPEMRPFLMLRVYLSPARPEKLTLDPATRDLIDRTE
jgi:hypothetical protein